MEKIEICFPMLEMSHNLFHNSFFISNNSLLLVKSLSPRIGFSGFTRVSKKATIGVKR